MKKLLLKKIMENKDFLELFNDAAFIADKNKKILSYNYQYLALSGFNPRQIKDKNFCHEVFMPNVCKDNCILDECIKTKLPAQFREVNARDKKGENLSLWVSAFPLFGDGNKVEAALVVLRDMTVEAGIHSKYKILYEREREAKEHLEEVVNERTEELRTANIQLKIINKKLEELSIRDDLTNLFNYRYFSEKIDEVFEISQRDKKDLSCFLIDVDFFKTVNDAANHQFGDFVLHRLGAIFTMSLRKLDILARYGGDEFVVLLPDTNYKQAYALAKIVRKKVKSELFKDAGFSRNIAVSIGISSCPYDKVEMKDQLVKFADEALYKAKRSGRDTIFCYKDIRK